MFDNGYEFNREFTPLLKNFDIKPVLTSVENPQANAPFEQVHQVILNMFVTKDLDKIFFDYKYPWGKTLSYIAWSIINSYHHTITVTPRQALFDRDLLFNLTSVFDWRVVTTSKQHLVDIDNVRENYKRFTNDYAIGD